MTLTVATKDIVSKLWGLCHILRDDGITYHEYVTELTFLLFLKMAKETGIERHLLEAYRWDSLSAKDGVAQLEFYRILLVELGANSAPRIQAIFSNANTSLRQPKNLKSLTQAIDGLDWFRAQEEGLGEMYEGLLEKNANETKSGAGQYFTPRPLIQCMVNLVQPRPGERVQDPAAGTGGFLIAADHYIKERTEEHFALSTEQGRFQRGRVLRGGAGAGRASSRDDELDAPRHRGRPAPGGHVVAHGRGAAQGGFDPHESAVWDEKGRRTADSG